MSGFCGYHRNILRSSVSRSRYAISDESEHPGYYDDDDEPGHPTLEHLEDSGYSFDPDFRRWEKILSRKTRTCRRDHKNGKIKKGQRYVEVVTRYIEDDEDSDDHRKQRIETKRVLLGS